MRVRRNLRAGCFSGLCGMFGIGVTVSPLATARAQQVVSASTPVARAEDVMRRPVTINVTRVSLEAAIKAVAASADVRITYWARALDRKTVPVTVRVDRLPLSEALELVLRGTGLRADVVTSNVVRVRDARELTAVAAQGGVKGKVTDAKTNLPLRGASVTVDQSTKRVRTDEQGVFTVSDLAAGSHVVRVRLLGYVGVAKPMTVVEGQMASLDVAMESSVNALDQVVVTGTVVATELKAVPNAITVITAKQIEERGITRIDQLFRGDVPGLFSRSQGSETPFDGVIMYSRGASSIGSNSARGSIDNTNAIKTYVDGIELADPQYLSQIDPQSIERIEILAGPQASTIYGSNALNGVMQIFTKRGTSKQPQLTLELINGWVQSNFSRALTPLQDYTAQLNGVDGNISYNGGASWSYVAPWTPSKQTTQTGAFGGIRFVLPTSVGATTADFSYRRNNTHNVRNGRDDQLLGYLKATGWYMGAPGDWNTDQIFSTLNGETFGVTMGYTPTSWWSHELTLGRDISDQNTQIMPTYRSPNDTSPYLNISNIKRSSLRYTTTVQVLLRDVARMTFTAGGDSWQDVEAGGVGPTAITLSSGRVATHNAGGFFQAQLGMLDRLFLTYGMRAEWNPWFGKDAMPAYAPRYGATYSSSFGVVTAKLRASYGRSTRPPIYSQKRANPATDPDQIAAYGPFDEQIANPALGPEHQQGAEGGIELYFGDRASIVVTRYNQTVDGLVARILGADSVKSIMPNPTFWGGSLSCALAVQRQYYKPICSSQDADGYGYRWVYQNINAASLRNQGWELQGSTGFGPLTIRGTYSWTKSRVIGITSELRRLLQYDVSAAKTYQPGGTFSLIPEHTGAMGLTYARARTSASLNMTWTGALRSDISESKIRYIDSDVRLNANRWIVGRGIDGYRVTNAGYAQMDFVATHRFMPRAEALVQVLNLTDLYPHDYRGWYTTMGRQTKVGVRIR